MNKYFNSNKTIMLILWINKNLLSDEGSLIIIIFNLYNNNNYIKITSSIIIKIKIINNNNLFFKIKMHYLIKINNIIWIIISLIKINIKIKDFFQKFLEEKNEINLLWMILICM